MSNLKKIIALVLSCFILMSWVSVFAADEIQETITWKAGYDATNNPDDIHYDLGEWPIGQIGADYGEILDVGYAGRRFNYMIETSYSGYYMLDVEMTTPGTELGVYINDSEDEILTVKNITTGTWGVDNFKTFSCGALYFEADTATKLSFALLKGTAGFKTCTLTYIPSIVFEGASVLDGGTVTKSTDVFSLEFNNELNGEKLSQATVTLEEDGGNTIDLSVALNEDNEKKIDVILLQSLEYGKEYALKCSGVTDKYGYVSENEEVNFSVSAEDTDESENNSSVVIDSIDFADNTFTLSGTVKGSRGQRIKGRTVTAKVTHPSGNIQSLENQISGEDGLFSVSYEIEGSDDDNGAYVFEVSAEFVADSVSKTGKYISEEEKQRLLKSLEDKETAEDVENFLTPEICQILGLDLSELDVLSDKTSYYDRLADSTYKNDDGVYDMQILETVWVSSLALEIISSSDNTSVIQGILENEEYIKVLDIENAGYSYLNNQKEAFLSAVAELEAQKTPQDFREKYNELLNDYLLLENNIESIVLDLEDKTVYKGQTAEVLLDCGEVVNSCGYEIEVLCMEEEQTERLELEVSKGFKVTKSIDEKRVIFAVSYDHNEDGLSNLGTLIYNSDEEETTALKICGKVIYTIEDTDYQLNSEIAQTPLNIIVKKKTNQLSSSGKSSYSSGSSTNAVKPPVIAPGINDNEEKTEEKEPFDDVLDVEWAKDSIYSLYYKGIISYSNDRKFRPNDNVTRAEFVKMLVGVLGVSENSAKSSFADVSEDAWYAKYVSSAEHYGLVHGDEYNNFRPNDKITRQDICVIISRAMDRLGYSEFDESVCELFADDGDIAEYAKNAVYRMRAHEIVNGMGDGQFAPKANASRAMTAKMLANFMKEAGI